MPAEHHEPSGHGVHCAADARPGSLPKVPELQGVGIDEPLGQNEPVVHSRGSMVRAVGQ